MKGLRVQCPNCKTIMWETTETYDPNILVNGGMVGLLEPWKGLGWSTFSEDVSGHSTTLAALMTCPKCEAALAPSGRITVTEELEETVTGPVTVPDVESATVADPGVIDYTITKPVFTCDECGKEFTAKIALAGHKRSHSKKGGIR